jgi:hypothetical protein
VTRLTSLVGSSKETSKAAPNGVAKATILTLPLELKLMIFSYLCSSASVCLGLSSKLLYPLHRSLHGKMPLINTHVWWGCRDCGANLIYFLGKWMDSANLVYRWEMGKFVKVVSLKKEEKRLLFKNKGVSVLGWPM